MQVTEWNIINFTISDCYFTPPNEVGGGYTRFAFLPLSPLGWRGIVIRVQASGWPGGWAGGCQTCGTHISVTTWQIFSVPSSVELSRPVVVHCHGHLPICPIWACPRTDNLSHDRVAAHQGKVRENFIFSRSGNCQGIWKYVREILKRGKCQGNVREFHIRILKSMSCYNFHS